MGESRIIPTFLTAVSRSSGKPNDFDTYVNQTSFEYTSTKSIFTSTAGPVQLVVTFLSGVTPDDLLRSSLPYTYMNVDVQSTDDAAHEVQLYTDISAEWVSGDHDAAAQWSYGNIAADSGSSPATFGPLSSASSVSLAPTVYGTQTAFNVPTGVMHTETPFSATPQDLAPNPTDGTAQATFSPVAIEGSTTASGGIAYHKVFRQEQLEFSEINQQANWGNW